MKLERVHTRKRKDKSQKVKTDKNVPTFSTVYRSSKVCPSDTDATVDSNDRRKDRHQEPCDLTKPHLPVRQTVKLRYVRATGYRTYRLNDRSPHCGDLVTHYGPKIVKRLCSQMKTHSFDPAAPCLALRFITTFKLTCDTNRIHEGAAM